jgi:hypothetical protein
VEVRHINRSSSATRHPKVDTPATRPPSRSGVAANSKISPSISRAYLEHDCGARAGSTARDVELPGAPLQAGAFVRSVRKARRGPHEAVAEPDC